MSDVSRLTSLALELGAQLSRLGHRVAPAVAMNSSAVQSLLPYLERAFDAAVWCDSMLLTSQSCSCLVAVSYSSSRCCEQLAFFGYVMPLLSGQPCYVTLYKLVLLCWLLFLRWFTPTNVEWYITVESREIYEEWIKYKASAALPFCC